MIKTVCIMEPLDIICKKLIESETIKQWCTETYNKEALFLIGIDIADPPKEEECPYVVIIPSEKNEGYQSELEYNIAVAWCIYNNDVQRHGNNVLEFNGVRQSAVFGQLLLEEIAQALTNSNISLINYTVDSITVVPQFPGEMQIQINVPYTMGGNKILF